MTGAHVGEAGRRWGTAARLTTYLSLVLAIVLGLALLGLLRAFSSQTDASTTRSLVAELKAFAVAAAQRPPTQSFDAFSDNYLRTRVLPDGETLTVGLADGTLIGSAGTEGLLHTAVIRRWAALTPPSGTREHVTLGSRHYLLVAAPVTSAGRPIGMVAAAADLAQANRDFGRVRALALGEGLIALLAGCAGAYLLLRRLLRRIGRITTTAADIGSGALDRRLRETDAGDEVGQLASTFDAMADQLSDVMATQRRLLSDVSHQLRTPLTVAQGHLEVLQRSPFDAHDVDETVTLVLDEIEHMKALVERLLMLGRAMEPDFLSTEPVDLRSFCADLFDTAQVLANRRWMLPAVPDVVVDVDAAKLRGALLNLIDNAVRATRDGDVIALVVATAPPRDVEIAIEDSGPGIPPERRELVLQRFARPGAADTQGSGLGLAIVRAVAEAHGGSVVVGDSRFGGCRISLRLPVAAESAVPPVEEAASPRSEAEADEEPTCVS
jgi:two-component system OmpR family sensor kinase